MANIEEIVAAAKAQLQIWQDSQIRQIRANHDLRMQNILAEARENMRQGLDEALAGYEQTLRNIQKQREDFKRQSPEVAQHMEKFMAGSEESAKKNYERGVEFIKNMYKKGLGIE